MQSVLAVLPELMSGQELDDFVGRRDRLTKAGVPEELATRVAVLAPAYALLGVVETAESLDLDPVNVARVHFALGERLGLPALVERIFALPRDDRWQTMARAAVRDDLYAVHQQLTAAVLSSTSAEDSAPARVAEWEDADAELIGRAAATLEEICRDEAADLARLSVGLRVVRGCSRRREPPPGDGGVPWLACGGEPASPDPRRRAVPPAPHPAPAHAEPAARAPPS